jgi:hypothetical protein
MKALSDGLCDLLNESDLYLQEDKNFVNNRVTGIQYGHVFLRDSEHNIPVNFVADLGRVTSKFSYLRNKFYENANGSSPICFVRRDINAEQAEILSSKISEMFPALEFKIACVNSTDLGISLLTNVKLLDLRIIDSAHDGLGHPEHWAAALVEAGLTDRPFQKTKEDIIIPYH